MISMTGYSKKDFKIKDLCLSLSIKSLNSSKGCDITIKTPRYLIGLEAEIRSLIKKVLIRGKINFSITEDNNPVNLVLNTKKIHSYVHTMRSIEPDADPGSILNAAIKLPDIFLPERFIINKTNKKVIFKIILKELSRLNMMRKKEGSILKKEIRLYVNNILKISKQLIPLELKRLTKRKSKILNHFNNTNVEYNLSRLESEMIYYFERSDITEERVRLQHHCKFFNETMNKGDVMGKQLHFISQEILREANTIGSKANDFEIQKRVVKMKEEIEKIKEQVQNIL
tara:strand:- start:68 stop:922 length:855 start_codon:yes stop_codon:yes gene_type:complete